MGPHFRWERQKPSEAPDDGMNSDIEPASNCIVWRVFPCLQAIAVAQVVSWLPVIECLVTVLNGRVCGGHKINSEEEPEGENWLHSEWCCRWATQECLSASSFRIQFTWVQHSHLLHMVMAMALSLPSERYLSSCCRHVCNYQQMKANPLWLSIYQAAKTRNRNPS